MVSEARKQSMACLDENGLLRAYVFSMEVKLRLEHLGALGTMSETAPLDLLLLFIFFPQQQRSVMKASTWVSSWTDHWVSGNEISKKWRSSWLTWATDLTSRRIRLAWGWSCSPEKLRWTWSSANPPTTVKSRKTYAKFRINCTVALSTIKLWKKRSLSCFNKKTETAPATKMFWWCWRMADHPEVLFRTNLQWRN